MARKLPRATRDDYAQSLLDHLPTGRPFPRTADTALWGLVKGLSGLPAIADGRAADFIETEADPRSTIEMLADWERNYGLPDPCLAEPLSIGERRRALINRMTLVGRPDRAYFIALAASMGYDVEIYEYRPFMVGIDHVGDTRAVGSAGIDWASSIAPPNMRFVWRVKVVGMRLTWFRVSEGQVGVDPHLRIGRATDLECLFRRYKPAHTNVIFDYGDGEVTPPPPDPELMWFDDAAFAGMSWIMDAEEDRYALPKLGPVLNANPTFTTDIAGYALNLTNGATAVWDATQKLKITGGGTGANGGVDFVQAATVGKTYELELDASIASSNFTVTIGSGAVGTSDLINATGLGAAVGMKFYFTATTSTAAIRMGITAGSAAVALVDNVKLREVLVGQMVDATRAEFFAQHAAPSNGNAPRFEFVDGIRYLRLDGIDKTNLLLNTAALATQDVTVTAQVYTLSFKGTGSVALSGAYVDNLAGTGAANRVNLAFFPSAGTLTLTVTGSVTEAQFEVGFLSPYIPSTGTQGVRLGETARLPAIVEAVMRRAEGGVAVRGLNHLIWGGVLVGTNRSSAAAILRQDSTSDYVVTESPTAALTGSGTAIDFAAAFAAAVSHNASGRYINGMGADVTGSDAVVREAQSRYYLGRNVGDTSSPPGDGYYSFAAGFATKPTAARQQEVADIPGPPPPVGYVVPPPDVPAGTVAFSAWPADEDYFVTGRKIGWKGRIWIPYNARKKASVNGYNSILCPDDDTVFFETHPGDMTTGPFPDSAGTERNKLAEDNSGGPIRPISYRVQVEFDLMVIGGAPNLEAWRQIYELHEYGSGAGIMASVFEIVMYGERLACNVYYNTTGTSTGYSTPWYMPVDFSRDQQIHIKAWCAPNPAGGGRVKIFKDGGLSCDYTGKVGCTNATNTQHQTGLYRGNMPANIAKQSIRGMKFLEGPSIPEPF